jgi:hypothetical protein
MVIREKGEKGGRQAVVIVEGENKEQLRRRSSNFLSYGCCVSFKLYFAGCVLCSIHTRKCPEVVEVAVVVDLVAVEVV